MKGLLLSEFELINGMKAKDKKALLARLARLEGQVRGIREMIDREEDCERIAQQLAAVRGALQKAFAQMMACAIKHRMFQTTSRHPKDVSELEQLTAILSKYG